MRLISSILLVVTLSAAAGVVTGLAVRLYAVASSWSATPETVAPLRLVPTALVHPDK